MSHQEQQWLHLAWDDCINARDLGDYPTENGGRTRRHALVRSDSLHELTPRGQTALCEYGVRTIIDVRLAHELESDPNPFAADRAREDAPRYLNLPFHDLETAPLIDAAGTTEGGYIVLLERGKELIASIIEAVAAHLDEGAVLVHCAGGKDRTGIVVALLLSLAGVKRDAIVADYAVSEIRLEPRYLTWVEEQIRATGKHPDKPRQTQTRPETMHALLDYLDREYGGVTGYLEAVGVSQAAMERIRKLLVTNF